MLTPRGLLADMAASMPAAAYLIPVRERCGVPNLVQFADTHKKFAGIFPNVGVSDGSFFLDVDSPSFVVTEMDS